MSCCVSCISEWLAAVDSSTMAAFCCVIWSNCCATALSSLRLVAWSLFAETILATTVLVSDASLTILSSAFPVSETSFTPIGHLVRRRQDEALDLLGGLGRALGERPDFGGDDREAASGVARARGFDAGVERQQVGLEGDLVDDADDLADLPATTSRYCAMASDGVAHDLLAVFGHVLGACCATLLAAMAFAAVCIDRRRDLSQRGRGFLQAGGLLLGPPREIVGGGRHLLRAGADRLRATAHGADRHFDLLHRGVEIRLDPPVGLGQRRAQPVGEILGCELLKAVSERPEDELKLLFAPGGFLSRLSLQLFGAGPVVCGLGFGFPALLLFLEALFLGGLDVNGDRVVHVQKHGLDKCDEGVRQSVEVGGYCSGEQAGGAMRLHDSSEKRFDQERIAADIPARLKTYSGVRVADAADVGDVGFIKLAGGERLPVAHLRGLRPLQRAGSANMLRTAGVASMIL